MNNVRSSLIVVFRMWIYDRIEINGIKQDLFDLTFYWDDNVESMELVVFN